MRLNRVGVPPRAAREVKTQEWRLYATPFRLIGNLTRNKLFLIEETDMRKLLVLCFLLLCNRTVEAAPHIASCIGDFCLYRPLTEQQFVDRFGKGEVRISDDSDGTYRCFYIPESKAWAEFLFSGHSSVQREMIEIFISRTRLCHETFVPRSPIPLDFEHGGLALGEESSHIVARMGLPSRVEQLSVGAKNPIFDKRLGDSAYVYETADSVLYGVVYATGGRLSGYRLSASE
jgi:hypothetical protein